MGEAWLARYRLLRRIGSGGMAEVFRAELVGAEGFARELVVKRMHPALALDPEAVALFINEARIAARLRHPNVVQVYDFGRAGDDHYLAMELVEGCDLAGLARHALAHGGVPPGVTAYVLSEVLDGLAYVHGLADGDGRPMGLVHRDVSPHNVLLGAAGEVKLADFGIARVGARVGETAPQVVRGKYGYMAPEQARGEALDARADLFAVGAMLYELLTGRRPHAARPDGDVVDAVREGRTVPVATVLPGLHPALAEVIGRALASAPDARYPDAESFRTALRAAFDAAGIAADEEALRATVREILAVTEPSSALRADPTATFSEEGPVTPPVPEEGTGSPPVPVGTVVAPGGWFPRRLLDAMAMGVGVAVVALVVGRRFDRDPAVQPGGVRGVTALATRKVVRVALPADGPAGGWLDADARRQLESGCDCVVSPVRYGSGAALAGLLRDGEADVAEASTVALRALVREDLVRRLDTLLPAVDPGGWVGVRAAMRGDVLSMGLGHGTEGEGIYLAPAAVDVTVLVYRPAEVAAAVAGFPTMRAALEARVQALTGHGLPVGFSLRPDVAAWTTWDLLAAAWTWSQTSGRGRLWLPEGPTREGFAVWSARTAAAGGDPPRADSGTLSWDVALSVMGTLDPSVGLRADPGGALADVRVAAAIVPASALAWSGASGLSVAPVPRGDALALDASGDPERPGVRTATGEAWGWVMARGSGHAGTAARVLLSALAPSAVGALGHRAGALPTRTDVGRQAAGTAGAGAEEATAAALGGGHFALAAGPAATADLDLEQARPWTLWVAMVRDGRGAPAGRLDSAAIGRLTARRAEGE